MIADSINQTQMAQPITFSLEDSLLAEKFLVKKLRQLITGSLQHLIPNPPVLVPSS